MKRTEKFWRGMMIVCSVVAFLCIAALLYIFAAERRTDNAIRAAGSDPLVRTQETALPAAAPEIVSEEEPVSAGESLPAEETAEPVSVPIDFAYLQAINPDIYAWLSIPMTGQEYPVLQSSEQSGKYLRRDIYGRYAPAGSLFTEALHNTKSFNDPCTVIYGHNMATGTMFGGLENNIRELDLDDEANEGNYLTVYTPTAIRRYRIVCAGPYTDRNLLNSRSFADEQDFANFFRDLREYPEEGYRECRTLSPVYGDKILILSTCFRDSDVRRYVVAAVLTEQEGA